MARESQWRLKERKIGTDPEVCVRDHPGGLNNGWSPEQIAGRLCYEQSWGEIGIYVLNETFNAWVYAQPKGELAGTEIVPRTGHEKTQTPQPEEDRPSCELSGSSTHPRQRVCWSGGARVSWDV